VTSVAFKNVANELLSQSELQVLKLARSSMFFVSVMFWSLPTGTA
jgi:hypothetical protein